MPARRSECPISFALDLLGDRWSLLVVRDLGLKGRHTFAELLEGGEGIARNILADRLKKLEHAGIVSRMPHETDGRRHHYALTEKGKDLLPLLVEMIVWAAKHDAHTTVSAAWVRKARRDREGLLARLRRDA